MVKLSTIPTRILLKLARGSTASTPWVRSRARAMHVFNPPYCEHTAGHHLITPTHRGCLRVAVPQSPSSTSASLPRPRLPSALFTRAGGMRVGGEWGGVPPGGGSSSISAEAAVVQPDRRGAATAPPTSATQGRAADVPNTVDYNGETLTFGDYRRPSILGRCALTLAAFGPVGYKAYFMFRSVRQTWSKVLVALLAPALALILRSFIAYFHREIVLQPKLRSPESVAFPNSRFEDVDGLRVHCLREDPRADGVPGAAAQPGCVLHMNHGFGASSSSWSPVIRRLSDELDAIAIAHDTPGFGLTARAGLLDANRYSLRSNAAITSELLRSAIGELDESTAARRRCILMGHSMGAITAATASLDPSLPPGQTTLVLVAPAVSLPKGAKKLTAEQQRASARREAATAAAAAADPDDGLLRGGGGGVNVAASSATNTGWRGVWTGTGAGAGAAGIVGVVAGAPVRATMAILHLGVWVFNWCLLPMLYPLEILGLRALVYRGNFWRNALKQAWVDTAGVDLDVINRYRWPTLVRYWDRGFALFLLDRLQIGRGGRVGPSGLVEAVAVKAAQGMEVIVVQGEDDVLIRLGRAKAIADAIPGAKLVVLPKCGHVPNEERPDDFMQLLLEQLRREDANDEAPTG